MNAEKSKFFKILHLILGLFFSISGIVTIGNKHYIFSIWIISLGLSFLIDPLKNIINSRISLKIINKFIYFLYSIVIISGVIVFMMEFNVG